MLEMFVYPVSAVMQFWHWVLAGVFSVSESGAWAASIVLLVFTVRGLILPFAWQTIKTARTTYLMRPHLEAVSERYGKSTDPEDLRAEDEARERIQKDHGYNPFASCIPAMIQIPMFLGLYRLLLWMAVPDEAEGRRIGVLTDSEIASFRDGAFFGVPLPAYVAMSPEQFDFLGTSLADVRSLALPLIITAIILTSMNLLISQVRNSMTLEWNSTTSRVAYKVIYWAIPAVAISLLAGGLTGKVPVALLMYWVLNNLFTTAQTVGLWAWSVKKLPSTPTHHEFQKETKAAVVEKKRANRERKRTARRKRLTAVARPGRFGEIRRELRSEKLARKERKASEKAERKALSKERSQARKVLNQMQAEEKAAERAAKKAAKAEQKAQADQAGS